MTGKPCFMSGTRIRTARGEISIDHIQSGDEVVVYRDGQETLETVKWVGYSSVDLNIHPRVENAAPIRLYKAALAENQPVRDLLVSPEHCLIIDGLCVPAKLLVNGGSIVSERKHEPFIYYHLELGRHGILLAENAPAESYLDTGNRNWFDNADEPRQTHPDFVINANAARWKDDACAPLAKDPDEVEPIWRRLAERSVGYNIPSVPSITQANLHVVADDRVIQPTADGDARCVFAIPAGVRSVSLRSRFAIPADRMIPSQRDTRRLGVRVIWVAIDTKSANTVLSADDPALQEGWNAAERDHCSIWRWTDGNATIPWENVTGPAVLTVRCFPADQYPIFDRDARLAA